MISACLQIVLGCGDSGQVENAVRSPVTSFSTGTVVTYQCNAGFTISGGIAMSGQMLCQFNGLWTEKPSCSKPVTTGELEFTSNLHQNFKYLLRDFNLDCSQKIRLLSKNHISHAFVTDGQCGNLNSLHILRLSRPWKCT